MANIHTPERQKDESFDDYKARRSASNAVGKQVRLFWNTKEQGKFVNTAKRIEKMAHAVEKAERRAAYKAA